MSLESIYTYECDKLLNGVDLFRELLPHQEKSSSIHSGEEGRFVENLVVEFLRNTLPSKLEVATGFVINSKRMEAKSGQVDILIYDAQSYRPIMKYGDAVIIHDKAVVAAISVKKNISRDEVTKEVQALSKIGSICGKNGYPKPYLAIFALDVRGLNNFNATVNDVVERLKQAYPEQKSGWSANQLIDDIIVLNKFIVKKREWKNTEEKELKARYIMCGGNSKHRHMYVQHLIHGIGKVLNERYNYQDSVLTSFPNLDFKRVVEIVLCTDDRPYVHFGIQEVDGTVVK